MSNKIKSLLFFVASIIVSIIVPIIVICDKYKLISAIKETKTSVKVSIIAAVLILALILVFFKKIIDYLKSLSFSVAVSVLKGIVKLIPIILILFIITNISKYVTDLSYCLSWIIGCSSISLLILEPLSEYFRNESKKDEQKEIIKESVTE